MKKLVTLLLVCFALLNLNAQTLIRWDFETPNSSSTLFPTFEVDTIVTSFPVQFSNIFPFSGGFTTGVSGFSSDKSSITRGWPTVYEWDGSDFCQFQFQIDSGRLVELDSISLWYKKSTSGPKVLHFRSNKDNYLIPLDSAVLPESDVDWHKWSVPIHTTISDLEIVRFRLYGNGTISSSMGTLSVDSVAIFGSVVPTQSLHLRAFLAGPFVDSVSLMHDDLRLQGIFPLVDPYGYSKTVTPEVLSVSGNTAIVDWVLVEIRSASNSQEILRSIPALLRRDGKVVSVNGVNEPVTDLGVGGYYVVLRHRNHLPVMTASPVNLSDTIDFTVEETQVFGVDSRQYMGSSWCLWGGDTNGDGVIKYTGTGNDRDLILQDIGGVVPTNTTGGYLDSDVNMDGVTKYTGSNNDRDIILSNIGGVIPTNIRSGSIP